MQALLVRVGIDQTQLGGGWNAPVNPATGEFVYVPIPDDKYAPGEGLEKPYTLVERTLANFSDTHCQNARIKPLLPAALRRRRMHLDPDFEHLTYGDKPPRVNRMMQLMAGDLLVFYAGLRSINPEDRDLVYGLIGLYVLDEIVSPTAVEAERWHENAHTRRLELDSTHRIMRARKGYSGRLERCLPIGIRRKSCYYVREELSDLWGGLAVKDGYISRSGVPPRFVSPDRFYAWFMNQKVRLLQANNP